MAFKFKRFTTSETLIEIMTQKIPDIVDSVESLNSNLSPKIYRLKFKDLEPFAYIMTEDPTGSSAKLIHYCEHNEKGNQCNHLGAAAAVAVKLGLKLEKASFGVSIADIGSLPFSKENDNYTSLHSLFELLEPVEDTTSVKPSTPAPTTSGKPAVAKQKRDWKEGWVDVQDYLKFEGFSTRMITKVQAKRAAVYGSVEMRSMTVEPSKPNYPYHGVMLERAIRHILSGKDLILVGSKGSGKDTLISTISWILGLPMTVYVGNKDETKESLVGEPAFRNGETTFDPSEFSKTIEFGGIINMAEINMLVGDVTSILHSVTDENRVLASPVGAIKRHEHSVILGSMNLGEGYIGVKTLNDAFKDRFAVLRLPYAMNFKSLIESKTGFNDSLGLSFLEKIKNAIDTLMREESQGTSADTLRGYIDSAHYFLNYGVTFDTKVEVIEDYLLNKIEDIDEYMAARHMIREKGWKDFPKSPEEEQYITGGI
ncbi:AAA family ATPase [Bacillus infantis]|uniref:AAA family ATPase n=1 Tax=Bacillus infantis TaxID=324767 RepID=UPI0020A20AD5|nr:AAA family ATPase [Bacillus infantis]MCP1161411.1 AAA family ATPase [Bacillus infantis]